MSKQEKLNQIVLIIDNECIEKYYEEYFIKYPKRKKKYITSPIPPSLNQYLVMTRLHENSIKQIWKDFVVWIVEYYGYTNKKISKCSVELKYFFSNNRRHDADNYSGKMCFDGLVESGMLIDDSFDNITELKIKGYIDKNNPRLEIIINI